MQIEGAYQRIAEYCRGAYPEICSHIIRVADDVMQNIFMFDMPWDMERTIEPMVFDGEIDWHIKGHVDDELVWQFNRHRFMIILAQAYYLTGKECYAEKCASLLHDWITRVPYDKKYLPWRPLECGIRGTYWTQVMAMLGHLPCMQEIREEYLSCLRQHADVLLREYNDYKIMGNWGIIQNSGLFDIALELGDDTLIDKAVRMIGENAEYQAMDDGMHWEQSSTYHGEVLKCFVDVLLRAENKGIALPDGIRDCVRRMAGASMNLVKPNHCQLNFGDSDEIDIRDLFSVCALALRDGQLKYCGLPEIDYETPWTYGYECIERYREIETAPPDIVSCHMVDSGHTVMRDSYIDNRRYLHFFNGPMGGGHGHADRLHIDLALDGEDILVDRGRYTYRPIKARFDFKCHCHNAPSIDGKSYQRHLPKDAWGYTHTGIAVRGRYESSAEYEYIDGANLGYGGYIGRSVIWLKPDIYIILDSYMLKGYHRYTGHFNFAPNVSIKLTGNKIIFDKGKVHGNICTAGGSLTLKRGEYSQHYNKIEDISRVDLDSRGFGTAHHTTVIAPRDIEMKDIRFTGPARFVPWLRGYSVSCGDDIYEILWATKEVFTVYTTESGVTLSGKLAVYKNGQPVLRRR